MNLQIPICDNYPHFLWRMLRRPRKALRAFHSLKKMPGFVWIEVTNRGNLRCRSCSKFYGHFDSSTDMDLDLFNKVFDAVAPHAHTINLTGIGEFFFHRQVEQIWERLAERPDADLWITTNGKLLDENWIERLAARRCRVIFSIDGVDQETHAFNRPGGDLSTLVYALERARELELASPDPANFPFRRYINFLVMRKNMHQMPEMVDWGAKYAVGDLRFTLMNNWGCPEDFWQEQNPLNYRDELVPLIEESRNLAAEKGVFLIAPAVRPAPPEEAGGAGEAGAGRTGAVDRVDESETPAARRGAGLLRFFRPSVATADGFPRFEDRFCHHPFTSIYFSVDGEASICCASWGVPLGNIRTQTLEEIWHGLPFRRIRVGMAVGSHTHFCRVCDLPDGLAKGNPRDGT